jgi:hypothetical protein
MIDLHLYLGRRVQNAVPETGSYSDGDVYYGRLPQDGLDTEADYVKEQTKLHLELVGFA